MVWVVCSAADTDVVLSVHTTWDGAEAYRLSLNMGDAFLVRSEPVLS